MSTKHDFLRSLSPFRNFSERELVELARICDEYRFDKGAILAYQGDLADRTYIVNEGRLAAYKTDPRGIVQETKMYERGDIVQDDWLLTPGVHDATLRAATDGSVYVVVTIEMQDFLDRFPTAPIFEEPTIVGPSSAPAPVRREKTTDTSYQKYGVASGEVIEYQSRRTLILLAFEMVFPIVGALVTWTLLFAATRLFEGGLSLITSIFAVVLTLPFVGFAIYRYLDWANDYLLMTNRHLVHQEYDLRRFAGETLTLPLDQVQSVRVNKPNFIETFLNIGTLEVTTAAQKQKLTFSKINNPAEFEQVFNRVRQRERQVDTSRTRAEVRAFLREEFAVPAALSPILQDGESASDAAERVTKRRGHRNKLRRRIGTTRTRLDDNTIVYGKHWIVLAQQVWWLSLLMLATIGATIATWSLVFTIPFTFIVGGFVFLLEAAYFYYVYEDWANDVFMLTGDLVIDIDRGPFGFTENRKAAQLGNVQDVRAVRPNIISAIFKYGNVVIDTAGASAEIIFENVANPTLVQSDIFERRQHVIRRKQAADATSRRREFGLILREFQQLQANEDFPDYALPDSEEEDIENF